MEWLGNVFTKYSYTTTDVTIEKEADATTISSVKSNFKLQIIAKDNVVMLPERSPFKDWKEARHFAGPLPFTFTCSEDGKEVLIVEGVREDWTPKPVEVIKYDIGFMRDKDFKGIVLANAFLIENIPYYWKKGKTEIWNSLLAF